MHFSLEMTFNDFNLIVRNAADEFSINRPYFFQY